ncbi:MAG: phosphate ABC transporter ATP-binding protein [Pseudomonadota bacterium]|nr:MAG: ABC transporter ATP-binding protein [Pseudomonadota bacterium]
MDKLRESALSPSILPLKLENVSFAVNGHTIIDRISFELDAGLRTIIIGPNGAGKSVLMRLCHGLLQPTSGTIRWNVETSLARPRQAMVLQRPVMLRRSALANIEYALALHGIKGAEGRERALEALEMVGLRDLASRPARVMSGGEQQRVALARAWALRPQVLFLDEPTASLDPTASAEVERIVQAIHDAGTKIVMTTHNLGQARRLGDEVLFILGGRLVERASVDRFFKQPATAEAAAFLKGELPWT